MRWFTKKEIKEEIKEEEIVSAKPPFLYKTEIENNQFCNKYVYVLTTIFDPTLYQSDSKNVSIDISDCYEYPYCSTIIDFDNDCGDDLYFYASNKLIKLNMMEVINYICINKKTKLSQNEIINNFKITVDICLEHIHEHWLKVTLYKKKPLISIS